MISSVPALFVGVDHRHAEFDEVIIPRIHSVGGEVDHDPVFRHVVPFAELGFGSPCRVDWIGDCGGFA